MRLTLNLPIESLRDERSIAWDVSMKGHWGNGTTEVPLNEESDFTYVMGLVRQAFEYQMGGE
jgi:predicted transport protein